MTLDEIIARCIEVGDCTEWQGSMGCGKGSGTSPVIKTRKDGKRVNIAVCREVWKLTKGPIPPGKIIYRTCCNERCVTCLAVGIRGDAMRQRKKLGLSRHTPATRAALTLGARARSTAKYSMETAREVRALASEGLTYPEIMARTGLPKSAVSDMQRRHWQDTTYASSVFAWRPA